MTAAAIIAVLLPGVHGHGELFGPFCAAAPTGYATHVVSYPKHEIQSYDQVADQIRQQLPSTDHIIIAESYSGPAAALVSAMGPPGLLGLVLCNSFITPPASRLWTRFPFQTLFRIPGPSFIIRRYFVGSDADRSWISRMRHLVLACDPAVLAARTRATLTVDVREPFAKIGIPILDLRGTRDSLVSPRMAEIMAGINSRLIRRQIPGAPHLLLQVAGAAAWQAIDVFVRSECIR